MTRIYADNGATSFPKPKSVAEAMIKYIEGVGSNVGRGTYESSYEAGRVVYETRELLCELFNFEDPMHAVFTSNITESLNTLIKGYVKTGDSVLVSSMEHNAVMRPLHRLKEDKNIEIISVPCSSQGILQIEDVEKRIKSNTALMVMLHASNVCGTIMPVKPIGELLHKRHIPFVLDTAQTAGVMDIDFKELNLSALAFTGHKGLLGPQGVGGFLITEEMAKKVRPLKEGGTGSFSSEEIQPETLPDKYESGTINIPGIFGLNAALKYLKKEGLGNIRKIEQQLSQRFLEGIENIKGIRLSGIPSTEGRTAVFSLDFYNGDNAEAAFLLDRDFQIMTRVGLHCAPSAHKTLNTYPQGSVRFSFGPFNTLDEVDYIVEAINKVVKEV